MSSEKMEQLVGRLEAVTNKLESISLRHAKDEPGSAFLEPFNELMTDSVAKFVEISNKIGGDVKEAGLMVQKGFQDTYNVLKTVAVSKKPSKEQAAQIFKPISDSVNNVKDFASKNFKSQFKTHLEAVSSFAGSFGWVQAVCKPQAFISESIDSGMFYANRVLTGFKDKGEEHKQWVTALRKCFDNLKEYAQEWHGTGCAWNPMGSDMVSSTAQQNTPAPEASAPTSKPAPAAMGALFSELNKGTGITGGLKKVDDSQKTHKNPNLRAGAVVKEVAKPVTTKTTAVKSDVDRPPVMELTGKKWMIEYQKDQQMLDIKEGDISYSVYMHKCVNTNVMIHQKINIVTLDNCVNCKVQLVKGLISSAEITNCKKAEIHADDVLPFVNVNKTDGCQIYLNDKSKDAKVSTSVCSTVNVCHWDASNELIEYPIPHLYISYIKDGKLVTEVAENM